jgi:hypothetical protein
MVFLIPLTPIYHKLPYDKVNVPVKRINAFHNLFVSDVQIEKAGESDHLSDISKSRNRITLSSLAVIGS